MNKKFDPKKLEKLNNPERIKRVNIEFLLEKLSNNKNFENILEIGAGTGLFSRIFIEKFKPAKFYACDIAPEMIDYLKLNIVKDYPQLIPILAKAEELPLENNLVDLVLLINVYHELDGQQKVLQEVKRVLREKGILVIVDWKKEEMDFGPPYNIRISENEIKNSLKMFDFKDIEFFDLSISHYCIFAKR